MHLARQEGVSQHKLETVRVPQYHYDEKLGYYVEKSDLSESKIYKTVGYNDKTLIEQIAVLEKKSLAEIDPAVMADARSDAKITDFNTERRKLVG